MSTFHAVVWIDHQEAHVMMFDREHMRAQRIHSRSHHKHQGKPHDSKALFADVAVALAGVHEVLLTGPGMARDEFATWCKSHSASVAAAIADSIPSDHPTDAQVVALARKYFKKLDQMGLDPALASA
jgi:stalled ribosome rescue protein Dom34